jgi:mannose-6-phosphate isomerase
MDRIDEKIKAKIIKDVRPWGNFVRYVYSEKCTVKIIEVNPNQMLSKQVHKKRDELWVVLDKGLRVELDDKVINPKPGDEIVVKRNTIHRLSSLGRRARILEISFGDFDENDIVRLEDVYGRV